MLLLHLAFACVKCRTTLFRAELEHKGKHPSSDYTKSNCFSEVFEGFVVCYRELTLREHFSVKTLQLDTELLEHQIVFTVLSY